MILVSFFLPETGAYEFDTQLTIYGSKSCIFSDYNYLKITIWISFFWSYENSAIPTLPTYQIITFYLIIFLSCETSQVSSTNFRDKLQLVNLVKLLAFDLTKIPSLGRLISISRLIVVVLNNQNLFTESNLANWFSSYVQFHPCGHFSEQAEAAR